MIIYNITVNVNQDIHDEWLQWQQEVHIPEIMATGCFEKYQLLRLLEVDGSEGATYAVQFFAANKPMYEKYIEIFATALRNAAMEKWGNRFVSFRTVMEVVH